ncbi:MAG: OmpA family protein [Comamonadaceae bacterium]|nr:MAG: OmpA family protein [Comamonadaceae bacterium]
MSLRPAALCRVSALCMLAVPMQALAQVPAAGSLRDRPSLLERVPNAPETRLQPQPGGTELSSGGRASTLRSAQGPHTNFRLAEVPAARLDSTLALLRELNARQTPDQSLVVALPSDVLFDFDSAVLRPDAGPALERAAGLLQSYPRAPLAIHGHTDARGTDAYNDALSQRRAQAVAARLQPLAGGRSLAVRGYGEQRPVAPNTRPDGGDDPQGRQKNRRVEIVILPVS